MLKGPLTLLTGFMLICLGNSVSAQTAPPALGLPVACKIGSDCFVQKLVDLQPGPGRQDYRCGTFTTEEHKGVDIRVRTLADMAKGVAVLAAADGVVLRTRDGMADQNIRLAGQETIGGKDAGNGVVIAHGNGWETQYSHLRKDSVRVKNGDRVTAGTVIGFIGMSGNTEYPHVHFDVRKDGQVVDPFLAAGRAQTCAASGTPAAGLWRSDIASQLSYAPTFIISAGFSAAPPTPVDMRKLPSPVMRLPASSAALVMWVDASAIQSGDIEKTSLTDPAGKIIFKNETQLSKSALSWFSYFGKKRPAPGWPAGNYRGTYELVREGKIIARTDASVVIQ
jgi:hypothetical protein